MTSLVEDDVLGELAEHGDRPLPRRPTDDDDTRVGEVARQLGLDPPDRPLLEDVGDHRAVPHRDSRGRRADPLQVLDPALDVTGPPSLVGPGQGDRVGGQRPPPDVVLGGSRVAARPDPHEPERPTGEGHAFVVVPLVTLERDVDDRRLGMRGHGGS